MSQIKLRTVAAGLAAATIAAVLALPARAADSGAEPRFACRTLLIAVPADAYRGELSPYLAALEDHLADLELCLEHRTLETQEPMAWFAVIPDLVAVVVFDPRAPEFVAVFDSAGVNRASERRFYEEETRSRAEALAITVRSTVLALLGLEETLPHDPPVTEPSEVVSGNAPAASASLSKDRGAPPASLFGRPSRRRAAKEVESLRVFASLGYRLALHSKEAPVVHGPALALGVLLGLGWEIQGDAWLELVKPRVERGSVGLELTHHPGRLGFRWNATLERWSLGVGLFACGDYVTREVWARDPGIRPRPENGKFFLGLQPDVVVLLRLAPRVALYLDLGFLIGLSSSRFILRRSDGEATTLLEIWRVRPSAEAGARFFLF